MPSRSTSVSSTDLRATSPLREPASPFSNSIQPSLKPSSIRIRGVGFFLPWHLNYCLHLSRGTASMLTLRPSTSAKVLATSSGVTRRGPSNSTTLVPVHDSWSSFAASRPMSAVATIGTALSRGCRKLMMIPLSRAAATSQRKFSMNHAGRRKVIGIGNSPSACSMRVCCVSRLGSRACAPIVDKYTTRPGSALSSADFREVAVARASGKPGAGSKFGGTSTKTPSAPLNAEASDVASAISACTISQPRSAQTSPLPTLRITARTGRPAARRLFATLPPTLPVIPVIAYIVFSLCESPRYRHVFSARDRPCRAVRAEQRNTHHLAGAHLERLRPLLPVEVCPGEAWRNQVNLDPG